jgi:uncharacterized membrane protein YciS (DUF1049 family)
MGFIKFIIGLPIVVLLLTFAFTNNDLVTLKLWPTDIEIITSLSVAIIFFVVAGYIIGWFFTWMSYSSVRSALRAHKKQNKKLSKEQEKLTKEVEDLHENIESMKASVPLPETKSFGERFKSFFAKKQKNI